MAFKESTNKTKKYPYTTDSMQISLEVDDMFCPVCNRMGYWLEDVTPRFVCPEHQGD